MGYLFEWDPEKAAANARNHDVTFDEATTVFGDPLSLNAADPDHSLEESRFLVLGLSRLGRVFGSFIRRARTAHPSYQRSTSHSP